MSSPILVIDDEDGIRTVMKEILESENWSVDLAADGEAGLKLLSEKHHPLVICDISMPGMSGLETLCKIREKGLMSAVVMLTAHSEKEKIIESLQLGAIDYVIKPFDPVSLLGKIANWHQIGKRIANLVAHEAESNNRADSLQKQLRMIELFKLNNYKQTAK